MRKFIAILLLVACVLMAFKISEVLAAECGSVNSCDENGICELKYSCWQEKPTSLQPKEMPYSKNCYNHLNTDGTTVVVCEEKL